MNTTTETATAPHTRQSVHDLIQSRWESDLPDRVLDALTPVDGKLITTRLLEKLPGGKEQWRLVRQYGWTELLTGDYARSGGREGMRLILARSESSVPLNLAEIERENPAYFAGRRERNHARMEAMNTRETLDTVADAMNAATAALAALHAAEARLDTLTGHDTTLNPERYEILRACGLGK